MNWNIVLIDKSNGETLDSVVKKSFTEAMIFCASNESSEIECLLKESSNEK